MEDRRENGAEAICEEIIAKIFQNGKKKIPSHRFMKYCAQLLSHVQLFVTLLEWVADSSVHGILQARILEWVAISYFRGSSRPRDRTHISFSSCIVDGFFTAVPLGKTS